MGKEKKDSESTPDGVFSPITPHFDIKRDNNKRAIQFEDKLNQPKSNDPFIKEILHISKDLPESPKLK